MTGRAIGVGRGEGPAPPGPDRLTTLAGGVLALFFGLPVLALILRAAGAESLMRGLDPAILQALLLSLATTAVSLVVTLVLGMPLAYALARRSFRGKRLVEALVDLPIVLPPSVAGLALLLLLGRRGPLGGPLDEVGLGIPFTTLAVVLAQVFVSAPLFVRAARVGFGGVESELEDAARVDGADERSVFRRITVPLAAPALAAGAVLAWARSLGEFGATIMFAGNIEGATQTLPLFVYAEFQGSLDASIVAAALLVLAAFGVLLSVRLFRWRTAWEASALA